MFRFFDLLERLPKIAVYLIAYFFVFLIGLWDYVTGAEISLSYFYLLPVTILVWKNGKTPGILASVVSALVWFLSNKLAGQEYSSILIFYWNTAVRAGFFLTTTFLLSEIHILLRQERTLSRTDSLTGVLNRRAFYEFAEIQFISLKRVFRPFTVVHFDIDNFKSVNDRFGHHIGDRLLQTVSETIHPLIRAGDRLVRLGGDEFMLFIPETGATEIQSIVLRLTETLNRVMRENDWPVSFSLGVVTFRKIPDSIDEMIRVADALMYEAKKSGKNKVHYDVFE